MQRAAIAPQVFISGLPKNHNLATMPPWCGQVCPPQAEAGPRQFGESAGETKMFKWVAYLTMAVLTAPTAAWAQGPLVLGPHAALCAPGAKGPAVLVTVTGFKDRKGQTRFELYAAKEDEFLTNTKKLIEAGKVFERVDVPTAPEGDISVCLPVPAPGDYAVVALHDRNTNGKLDVVFGGDGVALSRNPKLHLSKPKVAAVQIPIGQEVKQVAITLNYRTGLFGVGPIKR
jgi:uncharacterized protein (DUF2141 family)